MMLCKFDLEKSNDLSIPVLKQAIYVVKFQYLYSIEGFCRNVYSFRESTCCFEDERYAVAKSKGKSRSTQVRSKLAIQVGERIRKTRKQEGLSIENFALRCDIHPSYVGHIERGMQNPTLSTLERISQGLRISMEDLFKDIDTPINVENAAIRHLSQVISELSPEQAQQLLQIVDSVMAIKNEYL